MTGDLEDSLTAPTLSATALEEIASGERGFVHSEESMSMLDGPGMRYLIFLQGCAMRCRFCSNPDTWETKVGPTLSVTVLADRIRRKVAWLKPRGGGVSISGGDPVLQPEFVTKLFREVRAMGLTTCLCTSGIGPSRAADMILPETDIAIVCIKHFDREQYRHIARADGLPKALDFCASLEERGIRWWLQYVVIPGMTDRPEDLDLLVEYCGRQKHLEKVELLKYHELGLDKWKELGLDYPMSEPSPTSEHMTEIYESLLPRIPQVSYDEACKVGTEAFSPGTKQKTGKVDRSALDGHCCHTLTTIE
eukprot:gnl/Dysnectes_brevis/1208_a1350_2787.p1 GENE.gnl/Dysnectes_brevis/1208_a1350_2787~~gnl/Dysnectes_brevis/1208_a1350_2787.p1  ORF type:complete len:307 (+),score=126.49 gnl/Dysnectes_brevis/1208_a1350_2787:193-1113(+)